MLSLPVKNRRKKQPYLAIRSRLHRRQLLRQAQLFFPEVKAFMEGSGIENSGPSFLRYNVIHPAGELDVEFGFFTEHLSSGAGPVRSGMLPGGTYVSTTLVGANDRMIEAEAMLIGWALHSGVELDSSQTEAGTFFGARMDVFRKNRCHDQNPESWESEIAILVKGGI